MEFEFNTGKSVSNKIKHGIDFVEAQSLWGDPNRLKIPAKTEDEVRVLVIGKIREKLWTAVVTAREERIRIISVRISRKKEVLLYES